MVLGWTLRRGVFSRSARRMASVALDEVLEAAREGDGSHSAVAESEASASRTAASQGISGQQGCLWFANIYPTKAFRLDFRMMLTHHNHETLIPKLLPDGVEVVRMVPREREGGAFVYFRAPPKFVLQVLRNLAKEEQSKGVEEKRFVKKNDQDIYAKVCSGISQYLKTHEVRAFLCPFPVRAHRVLGTPYLEDLQNRYPGRQLRILCDASKLSEEAIYTKLRRYGTLDDLEKLPEGKGYRATFTYSAAAISARNCLHRARLDDDAEKASSESAGVRLSIEFEPFMQKWLWDQIVSNARYTIPLTVFTILGLTYFLFDSVRTLCVEMTIVPTLWEREDSEKAAAMHGFRGYFLRAWSAVSYAQSQVLKVGLVRPRVPVDTALVNDFWADRNEEVHELNEWMHGAQDRVMLLTGNRGMGQRSFVRNIVKDEATYINVSDMLEAGGKTDDQVFLRALCRSVGYWPAQGLDRQMSYLLDVLLPGSGKMSRENELLVSVQRILSTTTWALIDIKRRRDRDGLESKPPLFVIEGFTSENKDRKDGFFNGLVSWAAHVSEAKLARVLFICDSSFGEPSMLTALKDQPERLDVRQIKDADPKMVRSILERHTGSNFSTLMDDDLAAIGGRYRDIASLVAKVREGIEPVQAIKSLLDNSEVTVSTLLMAGHTGAKWTRPQLWQALKLLSKAGADGVPYDVFLWTVFRGDEAALRSLKESNLIAVVPGPGNGSKVVSAEARNNVVLPGSPLFSVVFKRLVGNEGIAAVLDLEVAKKDIERERATLDGFEAELVRLQKVDDVRWEKGRTIEDPNKALRARKEQLLQLIMEQHKKLEKYHDARRKAQAVLSRRQNEFQAPKKSDVVPSRKSWWSWTWSFS